VLRDIVEPNATINPDGIGYVVTLKNGERIVGTRLGESPLQLRIAQIGGALARLDKPDIVSIEPLPVSLMPPGLEKNLTPAELRDLMTFLLTAPVEEMKPLP
jgi:putative heme-binding domain-containing protein